MFITLSVGSSGKIGLEGDGVEDGCELMLQVSDGTVVDDVIISGGDRSAFLEVFDLALVAFADFLGVEGAMGALSDAFVAQVFVRDDSDEDELAREFMLKRLIFSPGVNSVEDDAFLASGDEVVGLGDSLADDPIFAFGLTDHFAEFAFVVRGIFDAAFFHFFINHAAEIDFRDAFRGEIIDGDGFTTAAHADDGEEFDVALLFHNYVRLYHTGREWKGLEWSIL